MLGSESVVATTVLPRCNGPRPHGASAQESLRVFTYITIQDKRTLTFISLALGRAGPAKSVVGCYSFLGICRDKKFLNAFASCRVDE